VKMLALERIAPRERILLLVMVGACALLLIDFLFVRPVGRRIGLMEAEIGLKQARVGENAAILASAETVAREYESVRGVIGVALSPSAAIDEMKGEIDEIARKNGVVLQSMDHREGLRTAACQELFVEIGKCEAGFQDLLKFLCAVQDSRGLLRIERLSLSPAGAGDRVKGSVLISKAIIVKEP